MNSSTTIIAAIAGATGLTVLAGLLSDNKSFKPVIGGFVVGTALLALALVNTPIAVALALLMLGASVLRNAPGIMAKVGTYGN